MIAGGPMAKEEIEFVEVTIFLPICHRLRWQGSDFTVCMLLQAGTTLHHINCGLQSEKHSLN